MKSVDAVCTFFLVCGLWVLRYIPRHIGISKRNLLRALIICQYMKKNPHKQNSPVLPIISNASNILQFFQKFPIFPKSSNTLVITKNYELIIRALVPWLEKSLSAQNNVIKLLNAIDIKRWVWPKIIDPGAVWSLGRKYRKKTSLRRWNGWNDHRRYQSWNNQHSWLFSLLSKNLQIPRFLQEKHENSPQ